MDTQRCLNNDCPIWQYTDSAHGPDYGVEALGLCLNWFMGSYADLLMQLGADEPSQPPTISLEERVADNTRRIQILEDTQY